MISTFLWVSIVSIILAPKGFCKSLPDSAGMFPQTDGLAYGGIPYGSISGQLSLYFGDHEPITLGNKVSENDVQIVST